MRYVRDWHHCQPLVVAGLMSGTSVDGIDAVCVDIQPSLQLDRPLSIRTLATGTYPYPDDLRQRIIDIAEGQPVSVADMCAVDDAIAQAFGEAALRVSQGRELDLIGSHGQTVFHRPPNGPLSSLGYSVQLGRGAAIAAIAQVPTVSNFRAADIAIGGQGAPLVPKLDALMCQHATQHRCLQNIGGIGNVTYLPPVAENADVVGWDTGPGNVLIDLAVQQFSDGAQTYDRGGQWAASGSPDCALVQQWMDLTFFHQHPPKSTGRELFSATFLHQCLSDCDSHSLSSADSLATITELTAVSIADSYHRYLPTSPDRVWLCGGGARNDYLTSRLRELLAPIPVETTAELGLDPDFREAIAFAVLAYLRVHHLPGNLPAVTGASDWCLLGEIHGCHLGQSSVAKRELITP